MWEGEDQLGTDLRERVLRVREAELVTKQGGFGQIMVGIWSKRGSRSINERLCSLEYYGQHVGRFRQRSTKALRLAQSCTRPAPEAGNTEIS